MPIQSQLLDGGFRLQQNGNAITDRVNPLALIALQRVFSAQHQRLAADGAGKNFQQVGRNHKGNSNSAGNREL